MGVRITNQRAAILRYLEHNKKHPTAEQVYNHVKKTLPHISKAYTVT